jgi:outer membrane lipoprotein carrier protein
MASLDRTDWKLFNSSLRGSWKPFPFLNKINRISMMILRPGSLWIFLWGIVSLTAQTNTQYLSHKDADPKARLLLKQVKDRLQLTRGVELDFDFIYSAAEAGPTKEKGTLWIKNKKFQLKLGQQTIYSDQKTVWTYIPKRNEVQIQYAADIESDPLSPFKLLQIHDSPEFTYVMAGETKLNGVPIDIIEFKPLDKNAEYFKIKAEIDRTKKEYRKLTLFLKSGDQYMLQINRQITKTLPDTMFVFDAKAFPGVKTEDLR